MGSKPNRSAGGYRVPLGSREPNTQQFAGFNQTQRSTGTEPFDFNHPIFFFLRHFSFYLLSLSLLHGEQAWLTSEARVTVGSLL
ncbi:hypothetical protein SLEP1_g39601 [Rubroshorea leprosula]|uniref:Uncharacterized protein n=1 Tax=Rubroshorea leprosula TaxID=152421 RepID=A0AAV5L0Q1_9ROSI|nr:hypothetical protein SLEP1_g39601 [Rubroshorea leprosula]